MRKPLSTSTIDASATSTAPTQLSTTTSSFDYVDLDSISDELICPICSLPFMDPVVHNPSSECGNTFCRSCVQSCKVCPFCRGENFQNECSAAPKIISKQLEKLKVICSMCKNAVCRGEYHDHQEKYCLLHDNYMSKLNKKKLKWKNIFKMNCKRKS